MEAMTSVHSLVQMLRKQDICRAKMIGKYLVENFDTVDLNGDGKISYAMFMGQLGNVEAIYRTQYGVEDANAVLEESWKSTHLEYFDSSNTDCYQVDQDGNWSATAANNYMTHQPDTVQRGKRAT